jgi:hypothetical protein
LGPAGEFKLLKPDVFLKAPAMAEMELQVNLTLVAACIGLGLLLVLVKMVSRISRRLSQLEIMTTQDRNPWEAVEPAANETDAPTEGGFETFLAADPGRRLLTKGEQAAAYRKWRQENGLNWTRS